MQAIRGLAVGLLAMGLSLASAVTGAAADDTAILNAYTLSEAGLNRLAQASRDLKALEARRASKPSADAGDAADEDAEHDTENDGDDSNEDLATMAARLEADTEVRAILNKHSLPAREFATATMVLLRLYLADGFAKPANKPFAQLARDAGIPAHQAQFFDRNRPLMDKVSAAMKGVR